MIVFLGDPTYFVLSHLLVALLMVVDFWLSSLNFAIATSQVSLMQEFWPFVRGCMYGACAVWFAYLTMRLASMVVKHWHWELKVASVDPGILGLAVLLYAGQMMWIVENSLLSTIFHALWSVGMNPEFVILMACISGALAAILLAGSMPLWYVYYDPLHDTQRWFEDPMMDRPHHFASAHYNDVKL
ncbi:Aste57867_10940 [Aphanomyces stellatus]|uniref:Aste57867_10940 protein n=1 Tax=Aphanomyces stellatus TaxID=120398 RepID=A0A485KTB9_9STRA|nr:hypothetical protein As57867_010900 [Aphanomyces stellatus]VFT87808.1 Aste57867_10940 [Aphanomyces stellatus]